MKDFDLAAAKRGATVCTRGGLPARILCFDSNMASDEYATPIVAEVVIYGRMTIMCYTAKGGLDVEGQSKYDLMMADDDYLEKLERGEYDHIEDNLEMVGKSDHIGEVTEKVDWEYWRRMYAGMAMQGMMADSKYKKRISAVFPNWSSQVQIAAEMAVECADALIEELKITQK